MSIVLNEIYEEDGAIVFCEARKLGCDAIVSKRGGGGLEKEAPLPRLKKVTSPRRKIFLGAF